MAAHHAKTRPLVAANAHHRPGCGCALHLDRRPFCVRLGDERLLGLRLPLRLRWRLRWWRLPAAGLAVGLAAGLVACSSTLDVRSLATERADVSAFELTGRDLATLRREASQLCPQGAEILRQSAHEQRLEPVDSRLDRWVQLSSSWITPPERKAQLLVLCKPVPDRHLLAAVAAVPALAAVSTAGSGSGSAPGPGPGPAPGSEPAEPGAPRLPLSPSALIVPKLPNPPSAASAPSAPIGPLSVEW